ncbi:MAG TPA: ABC transporter permease subunit [Actinomycetota bacterium]|nr:ABC transporter permease subunit [Actinomycetota bacterium]
MGNGDRVADTPPRDRPEAATAGGPTAVRVPEPPERRRGAGGGWKRLLVLGAFLLPALVVLGALVVYPILFSVIRSLYDRAGDAFIGVQNYETIFTNRQTLTAVKNNVIWVVFAPTVVTALGLVFAVLTERIRWATAFKVAVFMPMAISFLATGVIWRLIYDEDPNKGLANAVIQGTAGIIRQPGEYAGARASEEDALRREGGAFVTSRTFSSGDTAGLGLVALTPQDLPPDAGTAAQPPQAPSGAITGTVWLDFTRGGGGESGVVDSTEKGLPRVTVEAVRDGQVAATAETAADGTFTLEGLEGGRYTLRLAESNFRPAFAGFSWLGPTLVTPAMIVAYIWMWAGFAMVVIGAGLAAIPRDVMEAARVDGANEWQVFRRVTVPLLAPVLAVVLVTLAINVLKVFDIVLVMTSGTASAASAEVIALRMWKAAFGGARDFGLGSALAVFLFLLVAPAMAFNIKRFRTEG